MKAIELLVQEHDNILRMLDVIHRASLRVLDGAKADVNDFRDMVGFVRLYADKTHHGKEEAFLFKAMTEQLGDIGDNLVRHGMLVEHDLGRLYIADLCEALDAYEARPDRESALAILVSAGSYERLLRRHIQKENEVLFPFGEKRLPRETLDWLQERTHAYETDADNAALREQQLAVLARLEAAYR